MFASGNHFRFNYSKVSFQVADRHSEIADKTFVTVICRVRGVTFDLLSKSQVTKLIISASSKMLCGLSCFDFLSHISSETVMPGQSNLFWKFTPQNTGGASSKLC